MSEDSSIAESKAALENVIAALDAPPRSAQSKDEQPAQAAPETRATPSKSTKAAAGGKATEGTRGKPQITRAASGARRADAGAHGRAAKNTRSGATDAQASTLQGTRRPVSPYVVGCIAVVLAAVTISSMAGLATTWRSLLQVGAHSSAASALATAAASATATALSTVTSTASLASQITEASVDALASASSSVSSTATLTSTTTLLSSQTSAPRERVTQFTRSAMIPTSYRVLRSVRHDPSAFTQGLTCVAGPSLAQQGSGDATFIESTGLNGMSRIRRVRVRGGTGDWEVVSEASIDSRFFGEGSAIAHTQPDIVHYITWQDGAGFTYNANTMQKLSEWSFTSTANQGWGLTWDGTQFIETDGSSFMHRWELNYADGRTSMRELSRVQVLDRVRRGDLRPPYSSGFGGPLVHLNEIEFIHSYVFANIWQTPMVAIIDASTGHVVSYMDFSGLRPSNAGQGADVLNGLAYCWPEDATDVWTGSLWVTGKQWSTMWEVRLEDFRPVEELADLPTRRRARAASASRARNVLQ